MQHNAFSFRWRWRWCCWWQQQLLLIMLVHQLFLCHATWATRTATSTENATAAGAAAIATLATPLPLGATQLPLVSSSEATLLTSGMFGAMPQMYQQQQKQQQQQRLYADEVANGAEEDTNEETEDVKEEEEHDAMAQVWRENEIATSDAAETSVSGSSGPSTGSMGRGSPRSLKKNRYKIVTVHTNCTRDYFEMQLALNHGFRGLLYAKDFPFECRARGNSQSNVALRLPTSGCGVRAEPRAKGMEFSVRVMLQTEEKLRQSSDILRTIRCKVPLNAMGMSVVEPGVTGIQEEGKMKPNFRNGRMRNYEQNRNDANADSTNTEQQQQPATSGVTTTASSPRVRIWLELGGPDGSGAVEVGQATTLTVRAIVPGKMGVRVVDCAALDGLGDSTQQLLDERGCPIDEQVMPALHTHFKPAEEGWSKHNEDDLVEKTFTAIFPAFKFPDRERLHVSCGVQLCKGKCPNINCRTTEPLILHPDTHLARIEVFNSLAVTAPQIEVDRLRYDRRYNMSVEEYPPYIRAVPSEGTLCLSVSKLAISFCVLGFIFLIAVIVAIFSLIRARRRATTLRQTGGPNPINIGASRLHRAEVCTSMFSSSSESAQSARFGSKLFMPYYPNTLPYGRVY